MSGLKTLLPKLSALPDRDEALSRLRAAWQNTGDRTGFTEVIRGALAFPVPHPMVPLALRLAAHAPNLDVDLELHTLWEGWESLDLSARAALAQAAARRVHRDPAWADRVQSKLLTRPELGEFLVPIFLKDPLWFTDHADAIFAAYPHAKPAIAAAGQLLLRTVEHLLPPEPPPKSESQRMLGQLLDYDASEVFDKLDAMLDAAPGLGEALILEMAERNMDLRGVVSALRDRADRDDIKSWLQAAVNDELELLVYMAMV